MFSGFCLAYVIYFWSKCLEPLNCDSSNSFETRKTLYFTFLSTVFHPAPENDREMKFSQRTFKISITKCAKFHNNRYINRNATKTKRFNSSWDNEYIFVKQIVCHPNHKKYWWNYLWIDKHLMANISNTCKEWETRCPFPKHFTYNVYYKFLEKWHSVTHLL